MANIKTITISRMADGSHSVSVADEHDPAQHGKTLSIGFRPREVHNTLVEAEETLKKLGCTDVEIKRARRQLESNDTAVIKCGACAQRGSGRRNFMRPPSG
jgi:hypothetical protein